MTLAQYNHCIAGFNDRMKYQYETQDILNHMLGQYLGIAVKAPNKYPKQPFSQKHETRRWLSNEELMKEAQAMTTRMGGTVN